MAASRREKIENSKILFCNPGSYDCEKDNSVKRGLYSRKVNARCVKAKQHLPKKEKLLIQITSGKTRIQNESTWTLRRDPEYAYGQLNFSRVAGNVHLALTGQNMNGYCRFKRTFYGFCDNPKVFQEKAYPTFNYQTLYGWESWK